MRVMTVTMWAGVCVLALSGACGTDDASEQADTQHAATADAATVDAVAALLDVAATPETSGPISEEVAKPTAPEGWATDLLKVPRNIHASWQGDVGTTLVLQWATSHRDAKTYTPRLWIVDKAAIQEGEGVDAVMPYAPGSVFEGSGFVYREALGGQEVGEEDYVVWTVEATGLEPATEYVYRVGTWDGFDATAGTFQGATLSEPTTIRTGIPKGDRSPYSFVMAGDSRSGNDEITAMMPYFLELDAALWFFNGDMTTSGSQDQWDDWLMTMQPLMMTRPLMPVQGNHEIFANLYYNQFALPRMPGLPEELHEHAWSLDVGNIHFVGLDSNSTAQVEDQVPWLEADLAAARQDPDIDWVICMMHHAPYSASNHGNTERVQEHWVPLFDKHGVDLVFAGHDHNYERTHPVKAGAVVGEGEGPTYVVAGGFFSPAYGNGKEWWTLKSVHGDKNNFVHVSVDGKKLSIVAYAGDGVEILDQWTMTR